MRTILLAVILTLSAFAGSAHCQNQAATAGTLVGKWRLVEYYNDIGDGKGHLSWQKTDDKSAEMLEFKNDGTFLYTTPAPQAKGPGGKYSLEQDKHAKKSMISFTSTIPSASGGTNTWKSVILVLKPTKLELSGPGIEGSGRRYSRSP